MRAVLSPCPSNPMTSPAMDMLMIHVSASAPPTPHLLAYFQIHLPKCLSVISIQMTCRHLKLNISKVSSVSPLNLSSYFLSLAEGITPTRFPKPEILEPFILDSFIPWTTAASSVRHSGGTMQSAMVYTDNSGIKSPSNRNDKIKTNTYIEWFMWQALP